MKIMLSKTLVFAIIVLFIGVGIVPSMGGMISELSSIKIIETDITSIQSDSVKAQNSAYVNGGNVDYINIQDALNVASNSDNSNHYVVNQISRATGTILIIDDDNDIYSDDDNSIERFESVMGDMGYIVTNEPAPATDDATWSTYDCIVWSCGDDLTPIYDPEYKQMLIDYVADGGHLILESGHIAAWIDRYGTQTVDQNLRINVLHATTDFVYCDVGDMTFKNTHPIAETPNILPATIGFTATYPGDYSGDADAVRCLEDAVGVYGWSDVRWSGSSVASWVIEACTSIITYDNDDDINNGGQIVFLTMDIDDIDNIEVQNQLIENAVTWIVTDTENQYPIANFTYIPPNPTTADVIYFTDTSIDPDGIIVNWTWDFDDGNISYEQNPTHQYTNPGNYTVCLTIEDDEGATNSTAKQISVSSEISVDFSLKTGWNLIAIPVNNTWMASTLAENISGCQMVSWFDATSQELKTHVVIAPVYDFPLTPGYGYFILVNQDSTFSTSGVRLQSVLVQLYNGWNMIGWYNEQNTTASSLAGNITGCNMVSWFDATSQELKTHVVIAPVYDFVISKGMGLFILVDETSVWNGEG